MKKVIEDVFYDITQLMIQMEASKEKDNGDELFGEFVILISMVSDLGRLIHFGFNKTKETP